MSEIQSLNKAFAMTEYKLTAHGTRNVQVLKEALNEVAGEEESDIYGEGNFILAFQEKMAGFLGKEAAVFFPSGTMAQQIALRIWCDRKGVKKVAYHPLCHLEIHEEDGLKELHQIDSVLLADKDRVIQLEDVVNMKEDISCLLLELPQREIGGQLPEYQTLVDISNFCREKGIKLHLDGARLYEVLPFYQKSAAQICDLFDSVYISFYKGIGGVAGAILAGEKSFIEESKPWKRRYGGDLISLYPYIVSADYYFDQRVEKMNQYYENAKELAELYNQCPQLKTVPEVPVSNMFHVHYHLAKEKVEAILIEVYEKTGVGLTNHLRETGENSCYCEVSIGERYALVPKDKLKQAFNTLYEKLKSVE
jgi:threonine aldolase